MAVLVGLDWDDATAFDIRNKGWYEQAQLQFEDGRSVSLSFWDPTRLAQELNEHFAHSHTYFAERNLIILPILTETAIRNAIQELVKRGFFA